MINPKRLSRINNNNLNISWLQILKKVLRKEIKKIYNQFCTMKI